MFKYIDMSFLKIDDPKKRDEIVEQFLKTKKNIQQSNLAEKTGDIEYQQRTEKLFKPLKVTQQQIIKELTPLKDMIIQQPAITAPMLPSIEGPQGEISEDDLMRLSPIAYRHMMRYGEKGDKGDKTYGIHYVNKHPYIGNQKIGLEGNDIVINGKVYKGTNGLWELITNKDPDKSVYNDQDLATYNDILVNTNAIKQNNDPNSNKPKASKSSKWKDIIKPIWDNYKGKETRSDNVEVVTISDDFDERMERLHLLQSEYKAGNTGVVNEATAILDKSFGEGDISQDEYTELLDSFSELKL